MQWAAFKLKNCTKLHQKQVEIAQKDKKLHDKNSVKKRVRWQCTDKLEDSRVAGGPNNIASKMTKMLKKGGKYINL